MHRVQNGFTHSPAGSSLIAHGHASLIMNAIIKHRKVDGCDRASTGLEDVSVRDSDALHQGASRHWLTHASPWPLIARAKLRMASNASSTQKTSMTRRGPSS